MKTYARLTVSELAVVVRTLRRSRLEDAKALGKRLRYELTDEEGKIPCDMEVIGADEYELTGEDEYDRADDLGFDDDDEEE